METLLPFAQGAAAVGVPIVIYLVAKNGVPAAWAWLKAKWNAGKADVATLQGDLAGVQTKVASIETVVLADIKTRLAALEGAVGIKVPAPAAPPAPAFLTAAPAAAQAPV